MPENKILKEMNSRKVLLTKWIQQTQISIQNAPVGSLRISKRKNILQYYHYHGNEAKQTYIRDHSLRDSLAQKGYDQRILTTCQKELDYLAGISANYPTPAPEEIINKISSARRALIRPIELSDEEYVHQWMQIPYTGKEIPANVPTYLTARGERVRSKSEIIIANLLDSKNIPYRYEYPLTIHENIILHPDFTILNVRTRQELIFEHFGMMDDPSYAERAVGKINLYQSAGICLGHQLIATFETQSHPLNLQALNSIINQYCL